MAKKLMKGCEAIAEAAIQAGCTLFFGYPITPQNEIPEYMAARLPQVGGTFVQAESELAASNMIYGAVGAGERALTSSSSPGISLMSEAFSMAVDPHKWLYAAVEAGCALVRHSGALRDAFSYSPPYYRFEGEEEDPRVNYFELGLQNSRGFRALKVWLGLKQVGRRGYERMIADDIALARALYERLAADAHFEVVTHGLSIVTFRYVPEEYRSRTADAGAQEYLNTLNEALQERLGREPLAGPVNIEDQHRHGRAVWV